MNKCWRRCFPRGFSMPQGNARSQYRPESARRAAGRVGLVIAGSVAFGSNKLTSLRAGFNPVTCMVLQLDKLSIPISDQPSGWITAGRVLQIYEPRRFFLIRKPSPLFNTPDARGVWIIRITSANGFHRFRQLPATQGSVFVLPTSSTDPDSHTIDCRTRM